MDPALAKAHTIALVTFRKDGTEVSTPVTPVVIDGKLFTITVADSWKVKRIGRNPRVKVAPSTLSGKVLAPFQEGTARILAGSAAQDRVRAGLHARYGLLGVITSWFGKVRRSDDQRLVIEITV